MSFSMEEQKILSVDLTIFDNFLRRCDWLNQQLISFHDLSLRFELIVRICNILLYIKTSTD